MCKKMWTIAKLNLKNIKKPYFITAVIFAIVFIQSIVYTTIAIAADNASEQLSISSGDFFWLLIILAAMFIPLTNFRRTINLGGKRDGFFWGSLTTYAVLAGVVSLANTVFYYTWERFLVSTGYYIGINAFMQDITLMENYHVSVNLVELFGWSLRGPFIAVIQQFAFLFLLAAVVHTLTAIQSKWYGWVTDLVIAGILGVFIPIAVLRQLLLWFLNLIIFNSSALMQITVCMTLAIAIYSLNKMIFARKAI